MNDLKLKSIQRWENEGGALLPRDCNVHFWKYQDAEPRIRYRTRSDNHRGTQNAWPLSKESQERRELTFDNQRLTKGNLYDNES